MHVVDRRVDDHPARCHADLPLIDEPAFDRRADRRRKIRVTQNDQRVDAAQFQRDAFAMCPACLLNVSTDGG